MLFDAATKLRDQYNQEFQQLFNSISNDNIILSNLNWYIRLKFLKLILKWFLCLALSMALVYKVPTLNWNAAAIGRIVLLNLCDSQKWEHLYETDCLLPTLSGLREDKIQSSDSGEPMTSTNCDQCENIGTYYNLFKYINHFVNHSQYIDGIVTVTAATVASVFELYINYNQPIIIEGSHSIREPADFFRQLKNTTDLSNTVPCDLQSNILVSRGAKLNEVLDVILDVEPISLQSDGWFVSFRNCFLSSLKASRLLLQRPSYIPTYLKPFSDSWILISQEYKATNWKRLLLEDLVIVHQISGTQSVSLTARDSTCALVCRQFEFLLTQGDALVFSANEWVFFYEPSDDRTAIMVIREYQWK